MTVSPVTESLPASCVADDDLAGVDARPVLEREAPGALELRR